MVWMAVLFRHSAGFGKRMECLNFEDLPNNNID